jgi:hypothetical protein
MMIAVQNCASFVIDDDHNPYATGLNGSGQIGIGDNVNRNVLMRMRGLPRIGVQFLLLE